MDKSKWKRFNEILNTFTEAKNNRLKINVDGREITLAKVENLLKSIGSEKINGHEFKEKYNNTVDDVKRTLDKPMLTKGQGSIVEILLLLKQIPKPKDKKTDEQPDTTDMPELESEEAAEQRRNHQGKGLKILTPSQMLSRLSISIAQLKARNNSEKLKTEIRQLLYSLYRSKRLTRNIYKSLIDII